MAKKLTTKKPIKKKVNTYPEPPRRPTPKAKPKATPLSKQKVTQSPKPKVVQLPKPKVVELPQSVKATNIAKSAVKIVNPVRKLQFAATAGAAAYGAATAILARRKMKETTAPKPKTYNNSMPVSRARQEVAQAKRVQATQQKTSTGTTKKVGAKATAYRETRHWGTSKTAMELAKKNRSRTRG